MPSCHSSDKNGMEWNKDKQGFKVYILSEVVGNGHTC